MNRCITCGKLLTRRKAENLIEANGHHYLVCCPLCKAEFSRDPDHYVAVADAMYGYYAAEANSRTVDQDSKVLNTGPGPSVATVSPEETALMLYRLQSNFDLLRGHFKQLRNQFAHVSQSGGLEGLRAGLLEHNRLLDGLNREMSVHAGISKFLLSIAKTHAAGTRRVAVGPGGELS